MISETLRQRFLQDPLPIRLGNLASDLARIAFCAENPQNRAVVASVLEEGKFFAEWAASEAPLEVQEQLAQVQIELAYWHLRWLSGQPEPSMRSQAQRWSDRLIELSGLES